MNDLRFTSSTLDKLESLPESSKGAGCQVELMFSPCPTAPTEPSPDALVALWARPIRAGHERGVSGIE